jgi:1-deoxy-D-xylulose-5-phosphate synthase
MGLPLDPEPTPMAIGKARLLRKAVPRPDAVVVAAGTPAHAALAAAEELARDGVEVAVVDARFVKPLDEETICGLAAQARRVVTVEENALAGGFGSACLEAFERRGLLAKGLEIRRLGIPDAFVTHGDAAKQRAEMGIDVAGIARAVRDLVGARAGGRGVA